MSPDEVLNTEELERNLQRLPGWSYEAGTLRTRVACASAQQAIDLFAEIAELAQQAEHHPDVDWRYDKLLIALTSHDVGGKITARDVALAQQISRAVLAAQADLG